jgi:hypothetical protein
MRRFLPAVLLALIVMALLGLGWNRWPHEDGTGSTAAAEPPTTATSAPTAATIPPASEPAPEIVTSDIAVETVQPTEWYDPLVAVSAQEVWVSLTQPDEGGVLIGHLEDGNWVLYQATDHRARVLALAEGPEGSVWAATDIGVFAFYGDRWVRRFAGPTGGVATGRDGEVYIAGRRGAARPGQTPLWLARWEGASLWERLDSFTEEVLTPFGNVPMAVLPNGQVWMAHRAGYWDQDDLVRYDGETASPVQIPGIPDATPGNGVPAVGVFAVEATPGGSLWVVGYRAADPDQAVLAEFDGTNWTIHDWPFANPSGASLHALNAAAAPDGVIWFAFDGGLRSFNGAAWRTYLQGQTVYNVDVAPDGTVWYSDPGGVHVLGNP